MVMVGTQLVDLKSTLKPTVSTTKEQFISARVSRYTGERTSAQKNTVTQSYNFTNGEGGDPNGFGLLQE